MCIRDRITITQAKDQAQQMVSSARTEATEIVEKAQSQADETVSYTHLRAHETVLELVCRLLLEKKQHILPSTQYHMTPTIHITHNSTPR